MPNLQTDFITRTPYYEGQIVSTFPNGTKNMINKETGYLDYGLGVVHHATLDNGVVLPATGTESFAGITVASSFYQATEAGDIGNPPDRSSAIGVCGIIAVYSEVAIASLDDGVFLRFSANGAGKDVIGRWRTDADTATCVEITTGLKWRSTSNAAGLVLLEVNLLGVSQ